MMVAVFSPMVVLTIIMFSQNKQALHDVFAHANVVDLKTATIFDSIEEKEAYDAKLMNEKENKNETIEIEANEIDEEDPFDKEEVKEVELTKSSVFINSYPNDKVKELTLALQKITSLSIIEAKSILDNLPALVKTNLELEEANSIKANAAVSNKSFFIKVILEKLLINYFKLFYLVPYSTVRRCRVKIFKVYLLLLCNVWIISFSCIISICSYK